LPEYEVADRFTEILRRIYDMKTALTKVSLLFVLPRCIRRGAFGITGEMVDRLMPVDGVVLRDVLHTSQALIVSSDEEIRETAVRAAADMKIPAEGAEFDALCEQLERGRKTMMVEVRVLAQQFTGCEYDDTMTGTVRALLHLDEIYELWTWAVQARLAGHEPSEVLAYRDRLGPLADKLLNGQMPDLATDTELN
jgi:hypothetical protein